MWNKIKRKTLELRALNMRHALDQLEGALMGFDELMDQTDKDWNHVRGTVHVRLDITVAQLRRIKTALALANHIVNSDDYAPTLFGYKPPLLTDTRVDT